MAETRNNAPLPQMGGDRRTTHLGGGASRSNNEWLFLLSEGDGVSALVGFTVQNTKTNSWPLCWWRNAVSQPVMVKGEIMYILFVHWLGSELALHVTDHVLFAVLGSDIIWQISNLTFYSTVLVRSHS